IPEELGIKSAPPAPTPEQASSKSSRKKRKHMKLKPGIKFPRLEYNRALPENVPFANSMVIEEPEHEIFFTDEFSDQAFQRWSDIDKVRMEALVSYLVAASMVQSPENARFSMKLKKLIAEHPDQEKLKSKKVKLEAIGYEMNGCEKKLYLLTHIDKHLENYNSLSRHYPWIDIVRELYDLSHQDNISLKHQYPRLYALESHKQSVVAKMKHASLDFSYRLAPRGGVKEEQ
ncbi:hypothetical protein Tco_1375185, partial [Tanacetum coccineum]